VGDKSSMLRNEGELYFYKNFGIILFLFYRKKNCHRQEKSRQKQFVSKA